jgi:hypothetical protein
VHQPHGVIPHRDDCFCMGHVMEALESSMPISEWRSLHHGNSREVLIGTLIAASGWRQFQGVP